MALEILDARIDARAAATQAEHPFWPCRRGCDHCCRTLSRLPMLTAPEWHRVSAAIDALPSSTQAAIRARTLSATTDAPVMCPMLDEALGECRVYNARPIVCRTYGFYTERDAGLHCSDVRDAIRYNGATDTVIWGNGDSINAALDALGPQKSLREWMINQ